MKYIALVLREWMQSRTGADYDITLRPLSEELHWRSSPWGRSRVLLCSGARSTSTVEPS